MTVRNHFVINLTDVATNVQKRRMKKFANGLTGRHFASALHHATKVQSTKLISYVK